jgi:hypothetical protein
MKASAHELIVRVPPLPPSLCCNKFTSVGVSARAANAFENAQNNQREGAAEQAGGGFGVSFEFDDAGSKLVST